MHVTQIEVKDTLLW